MRLIATVFALACASAVVAADAAPVVLVTAYAPFDGRSLNGSSTIARAIEGKQVGGARITTLVLPVRWGEPQRRLPPAISESKPVLVLGLGEGHPKKVTFERIAQNRAEYPDVDKQPPPAATLDAAGPATRPTRLAFDAAWFEKPAVPVVPSDDAGPYLCNSLFYCALALPVAKTGFMHVPPQETMSDADYCAAYVPIVLTLIERNLATK